MSSALTGAQQARCGLLRCARCCLSGDAKKISPVWKFWSFQFVYGAGVCEEIEALVIEKAEWALQGALPAYAAVAAGEGRVRRW